MTSAERKLWRRLRSSMALADTHFRRQVAIGAYIADFTCLSAKLILEVDGEQHGGARQINHDSRRTEYLSSLGFSVLRFSNRDVLFEIDAVMQTIEAHLVKASIADEE